MAKITQKVELDSSQYRAELKKLGQTTKSETKRVNSEFNEAGNAVDDFSERTKRNTKEVSNSLADLAKGFKSGIGALSIGGLGVLAGGAFAGQVKEGMDFTSSINKLGVQQGLSGFQQGELRNQLLDISSKRDVEEEDVAAAASTAAAFGAANDQIVKFADVIAGASKLQEGLDPGTFAEDIAKDLRAKGQQVTAENAQRLIEALVTGARAGFKDIGTALAVTGQVGGAVQRRAGLTQRELVNMMSGAQLGAGAAPEEIQAAVTELVKITDTLEGEALQGVIGGFRGPQDAQGNREFSLGTKQLDVAAKRLAALGEERVQRQVLEDVGFSKQGVEGLLAIVRDRGKVERQTRRVEADRVGLEEAVNASTDNFVDKVSKVFNAFGNRFKRDTTVIQQEVGRSGQLRGPTEKEREELRKVRGPLAFPRLEDVEPIGMSKQREEAQTATPPKKENEAFKLDLNIFSNDPAFSAKPKTTDLNRSAKGL